MIGRLLLSYGNVDGGETRAPGKERKTQRNADLCPPWEQVRGLQPHRAQFNLEWLIPFAAVYKSRQEQIGFSLTEWFRNHSMFYFNRFCLFL